MLKKFYINYGNIVPHETCCCNDCFVGMLKGDLSDKRVC